MRMLLQKTRENYNYFYRRLLPPWGGTLSGGEEKDTKIYMLSPLQWHRSKSTAW